MTPAVERIVAAALSDAEQLAEFQRLLSEATRRFGATTVTRVLDGVVRCHDAVEVAASERVQ